MDLATFYIKTADQNKPFLNFNDKTKAANDTLMTADYPSISLEDLALDKLGGWNQETEFYSDITGSFAVYIPFLIERTSTVQPDRDMAQLSWVAEVGNVELFDQMIPKIDWRIRDAEHYVQAIQLALSCGAHWSAKWLIGEGIQKFPSHDILKKMAYVLLPKKALRVNKSPDPSLQLNREWFDKYRHQYYEKWVAIKDGNLLGSAQTLRELKELVPDYHEATVTKINW